MSAVRPGYATMMWTPVVAFIAVEAMVVISQKTGPFVDEAIDIVAGMRTFEGHGISDYYLTWFAGSLLWPILSAAGYLALGLLGARLVALVCSAIAFIAVVKATGNLFGERAAFWAATTFALNGPFLVLAHFATYDQVALAAIAVSFWAITELGRRDDRRFLALAAVAFGVGVIGKYPMAGCLLPLMVVLATLRGKRATVDIPIFGYISAAVLIPYFLLWRAQLGALLTTYANPATDTSRAVIAASLGYLCAVPVVLGIAGWRCARGRRLLATALLAAVVIWPAYHLLIGNPVSAQKHIVFGFLFAYPLAGLALARAWRGRIGRVGVLSLLVLLALVGVRQMEQLDHAWPDVRPAAGYLESHVRPGDRLLISDAWPYTMYLYERHRIASPGDVYDATLLDTHLPAADLCTFDWFVDEDDGIAWAASIRATVDACGTFERVYTMSSTAVNPARTLPGPALVYTTYPVRTVVWRNTHHDRDTRNNPGGDR